MLASTLHGAVVLADCVGAYLAARVNFEDVPHAPATQNAIVPVQHVLAGLVGEKNGPA